MLSRWEPVFILLSLTVGLAAVIFAVMPAEGHSGHSQKKLFADRWYQEVSGGDYSAWMELSASGYLWATCDSGQESCENKWLDPTNDALADWNSQSTTVDVQFYDAQDLAFDLNVFVDDEIFGDPFLQGIARWFDVNYDECFFTCTIWFAWIEIGDDAHSGAFGTNSVRRSTIAHEFGHILGLRHESVNDDESIFYDCGQDDTGGIPFSIMAYNCIDPAAVGGSGIASVQAWDVCGVNHAYYDPTIGYAGCVNFTASATPTKSPTSTPSKSPSPSPTKSPSPTPTPTPVVTLTATPTTHVSPTPTGELRELPWGDADCNGSIGARDNQSILRIVLSQNPLSQTQPCFAIGSDVLVGNFILYKWADADCNGVIAARDNQAVLRFVLGQAPLSQTDACPDVGSLAAVP